MLTTNPGTYDCPSFAGGGTPPPIDEPAFVAHSESMRRLLGDLDAVARSDATVLILGESGSGKELVARALHARGPRARGPFVAVNCAAFPDTLLEDELFGHERGAFTGAVGRRLGRFQTADGGTLLLDEVGELSPMAQAKLLRVLQEGSIEPLGTCRPVRVDVRVVAATHRDLRRMVADGRFREDLFYRLNVLDLRVPPLRERRDDLRPLVDHFLRRLAGDDRVPRITPAAWRALMAHPFPGNVRELKHALEHAVVLSRGGRHRAPAPPRRDRVGDRRAPAARRRRRAGAAGRRDAALRARLPRPRPPALRRQPHEDRPSAGHLAQEPVGEDARPRHPAPGVRRLRPAVTRPRRRRP